MKRPEYISLSDWRLLQNKYKNMDNVVEKIKKNYPIQYLIGNVDFYGYKILVNPNVLIPRFETETLVEKTLELINKLKLNKGSLLDIGTGSGCISVALKSEEKDLEITALDNSRKAIITARKNAKLNKVKINFIYKNIFKYNLINKYDIVISNPPYIPIGSDVDEKIKYEPKKAIFVDADNDLVYYEQIFKICSKSLNTKHLIAFEIDELAGSRLKKLAKEYYPKDKIVVEKDLAGKERFLFVYSKWIK